MQLFGNPYHPKSIPHGWRNALSSDFTAEISVKHQIVINGIQFDTVNRLSSQWYLEWVRAQGSPLSSEDGWSRELSVGPTSLILDWSSIFLPRYRVTRETKLQTFAYKLAFRLSLCNSYLTKICIKNDVTCSFCLDTDSISHFFLKCDMVRPFWHQFSRWCKDYLDISMDNLSEAQLLFGILNRTKDGKVQNWLILFAKFFKSANYFSRETFPS